jgi:hypothetical protein
MRGSDPNNSQLSSATSHSEDRVPMDHPLSVIRTIVVRVLEDLSSDFSRMYSPIGRPSEPTSSMMRGTSPPLPEASG